MKASAVDPEGIRLPIKLDSTSNGEYLSSASARYAEITPALRAKVFGLNGAKVYGLSAAELKKYVAGDTLSMEKVEYAQNPEPHFLTYGSKTRRDFLRLSR